MSVDRNATHCLMLAAIAIAALVGVNCGSGSPASPSSQTVGVASVSLNTPTIAAGATTEGTVRLTTPAPAGGAVVSLNASDYKVVTFLTPLRVEAGRSSVTFTATGIGAGVATIVASTNNTSESVLLTVVAAP